MSEQNKNGSESQPSAIDLTKYVPKEEFEKVQTTSKAELEKTRAELDQAKMSLLDPEYITYLEAKKEKLSKGTKLDVSNTDIDKLSPKELLQTAVEKAVEMVDTKNETRFRRLEQSVSDTLGYLELQSVETKYDDFSTYRDEVVKLLGDPKSTLTIEQAYKLAKSENPKKDGDDAKKPEERKKPSGEKPIGSRPLESFQPKDFKDKSSAALDAWDQVVGAGKDSL